MPTTPEIIPIAEYVRRLKPLLPDEAFASCPSKLLVPIIHLLLLAGGYIAIRFSDHWLVWLLCSLVIGHSLACMGFFAHEVSHNAIFRRPRIRYAFEVVCWGLNLVSPTIWRRVHNQTHHLYSNTFGDPDRLFLMSEACQTTLWYSRIFYPNQDSSKWNFGVRFHFIAYILRNTIAAFYPNRTKPILVPAKPDYTRADRLAVSLELIAIVVFQVAIFNSVDSSLARFIFASPIPVLITSTIVMSYIFTNHFLNPMTKATDPLVSTTSIVVHPIFDRLHLNFSYHTEHHIFPGMNSNFYPAVSNLLNDVYGDRYHRVSFGEAWDRLWKIQLYAPDELRSNTMHKALLTNEGNTAPR